MRRNSRKSKHKPAARVRLVSLGGRACGCGSVSRSKSKLVRKGPGPEDLVFTLSEIKSIRGLE